MTLPRAYYCSYKWIVQLPAKFMYVACLADFGSFFCIPSSKNCLLHFFSCMASLIQPKYFPVLILCRRHLSDFKEVASILYLQFFLPYPPPWFSNWHFPISVFFPILYRKFLYYFYFSYPKKNPKTTLTIKPFTFSSPRETVRNMNGIFM